MPLMQQSKLAAEFVSYASRKLGDHLAQIRRCVALLSEEQVWFRPNDNSNSVANLLLHLSGNLRQWIIGGVAGRPIARNRQAEFDVRGGISKDEALARLEQTVHEVCTVMESAGDDVLTRINEIQTYQVSGAAAILHVVEHFAFHTGQIVTTTKWLLDVDLSLYNEHGHRRDGRDAGVP